MKVHPRDREPPPWVAHGVERVLLAALVVLTIIALKLAIGP
jgi:hypothetical protein